MTYDEMFLLDVFPVMADGRAALAFVAAVCCVGMLAVRSGGGAVEMLDVATQAKGVNAALGKLKATSVALSAADSKGRAALLAAATEQSLVEEKEATTK